MTSQLTVNALPSSQNSLLIAVAQLAQESMKSVLQKPPGRQPHKDDVELSNWYNNLTETDKEMVLKVVEKTIEMAVFGFLCVLDGVRAIENGRDKGKLNLYYNKGDINVQFE